MEEHLRAADPLAGDWILLVILGALGMLGWINLVSPKKWRLITRSILSLRLGRQSLRDELDLQDRTLIGMAVMASATQALFAYQLIVLIGHGTAGPELWAELFACSGSLVVLQVLLTRLTARLFLADGGLSEFLFTLLLLHIALGIALLPLTATLAWPHGTSVAAAQPGMLIWRSWCLRIGLGLVALTTAYRWIRGAILGVSGGVPLRYVFTYLCALEILPVALACQEALQHLPDPSNPL